MFIVNFDEVSIYGVEIGLCWYVIFLFEFFVNLGFLKIEFKEIIGNIKELFWVLKMLVNVGLFYDFG